MTELAQISLLLKAAKPAQDAHGADAGGAFDAILAALTPELAAPKTPLPQAAKRAEAAPVEKGGKSAKNEKHKAPAARLAMPALGKPKLALAKPDLPKTSAGEAVPAPEDEPREETAVAPVRAVAPPALVKLPQIAQAEPTAPAAEPRLAAVQDAAPQRAEPQRTEPQPAADAKPQLVPPRGPLLAQDIKSQPAQLQDAAPRPVHDAEPRQPREAGIKPVRNAAPQPLPPHEAERSPDAAAKPAPSREHEKGPVRETVRETAPQRLSASPVLPRSALDRIVAAAKAMPEPLAEMPKRAEAPTPVAAKPDPKFASGKVVVTERVPHAQAMPPDAAPIAKPSADAPEPAEEKLAASGKAIAAGHAPREAAPKPDAAPAIRPQPSLDAKAPAADATPMTSGKAMEAEAFKPGIEQDARPAPSSGAAPSAEKPIRPQPAAQKPAEAPHPQAASPAPDETAMPQQAATAPAPQIAANAARPAPATHADTAPQPPARPDIPALASAIVQKARQGGRLFEIRLDPPELGRVEVHLSVAHDGKAEAVLYADRPDTLALFQRDSQNLERALKDAGLDVSNSSLNFSLKGEERQGDGGGASRAPVRNLSNAVVARSEAVNASLASRSSAPSSARLDIFV